MEKKGLVLLAHGSRNPDGQASLEELVKDIRSATGNARVRLAYLQFAGPGLTEVVRELADAGVDSIRILPMLLTTGNHAIKDIPAEVAALGRQQPGVRIEVLPPLGSQGRFKTMMKALACELMR